MLTTTTTTTRAEAAASRTRFATTALKAALRIVAKATKPNVHRVNMEEQKDEQVNTQQQVATAVPITIGFSMGFARCCTVAQLRLKSLAVSTQR